MRSVSPRVCLLAAVLAPSLAACGASDTVISSNSTRTDSAGVTIVSGPATDVPLDWTLTEEFRIGGADSGAGSFSQVHARSAATDAAGRIYVLDSKQHRVEVFDATGAHVRFLGRKGGGPGEFDDAFDLLVKPDGEVGVVDYGKSALVRWSPDGEVLPEYAFTDFFPSQPLWVNGDTLVYVHSETSEGERSQSLRIRTPSDTFSTPALSSTTSGMVMFSCIGLNLPPMFAAKLVWTGDAHRQAVTHQVPYRIDVYEGGSLRRSLRRGLPTIVPDESHVAQMHPDGGMKIRFSGGECTVPVAELIDKQGVAPQLPMVESLRYDPAGRLWAQRYGIREAPRNLDLFAPDGEYLGTLANKTLPIGFIGDDVVVFAETDPETELMYVVGYRVSSNSRQ